VPSRELNQAATGAQLARRRRLARVALNEFEAFRAGIDDLLRSVRHYVEAHEREKGNRASTVGQLSPGDCERIRRAIKGRHDPDTVRAMLLDTELAEQVGHQFLGQLAAADQTLDPAQVSELETHALEGLPELP
jgi:hypothetical protein